LLQKIFKEVLETEIWQKKRADLDQTSCWKVKQKQILKESKWYIPYRRTMMILLKIPHQKQWRPEGKATTFLKWRMKNNFQSGIRDLVEFSIINEG
jgi:hypothetical protein